MGAGQSRVREIGPDGYLAILRDNQRWSNWDDADYESLAEAAMEGNPEIGDLLIEVAGQLGPSDKDEISKLGADFLDDWIVQVHWQHPDALARFVDALEADQWLVAALFSNSLGGFAHLQSPQANRLRRTIDAWRGRNLEG